jgi:hypothetical protein
LEVTNAAANETGVEAFYVTASVPFDIVEATVGAAYRCIAAASAGTRLLAVDIARELETPGNLRDRIQMVRAELRGCQAFSQVSRGRWELDRPSGYERASLSSVEIMDYMDRLHENTRKTPQRGTSGDDGAKKTA